MNKGQNQKKIFMKDSVVHKQEMDENERSERISNEEIKPVTTVTSFKDQVIPKNAVVEENKIVESLNENMKQESSSENSDKRNLFSHINGCIRRGRFMIETAQLTNMGSLSTVQFRKGRFQITQRIDEEKVRSDMRDLISVINLQNKQIDILFDMIKNISGDDKLFQKEFNFVSNEVYEKIEDLKKQINN